MSDREPGARTEVEHEVLERLGERIATSGAREDRLALARELLDAAWTSTASTMVPAAAGALGAQLAGEGATAADIAEAVMEVAILVEEALEERALLGEVDRRRLRWAIAATLARALETHAERDRTRREGWLSFYAHEMRNPLNTLVNALWLLRNAKLGGQVDRICEIAERATKRLDNTITEVRGMERGAKAAPPNQLRR